MEPLVASADADRPREKLTRQGVATLGDNELLALIIGQGRAGCPALELATGLLRDLGGVHALARAGVGRLVRTSGVGEAKAARILAAVELGRRTTAVSPAARLQVRRPADLGPFLVARFGAHHAERFGVVLLDARHRLIRIHIVSEGSLDAAMAIPRDVFREATVGHASAVIVFHNHPSGDPTPTPSDQALTNRLLAAGEIIGIDVLDHLILTDTVYCSVREDLTRQCHR